jgi:hypothetical protein
MNRVVDYIEAAERDNTRRSYASAIRHFEIEWKGLLPSTADAIARYLADYAPTWGSKPEPPKIPSADQRGLSRARSMG